MSTTARIQTLDDFGFLFCFIGGVIVVVMGLLSFIVAVAGETISWLFGSGYIGIASPVAGSIVSLVFGAFAIVIGLKLFVPKIGSTISKMDRIIIAIIMIVISIIVFGIGAILILVGGILVLVDRLR